MQAYKKLVCFCGFVCVNAFVARRVLGIDTTVQRNCSPCEVFFSFSKPYIWDRVKYCGGTCFVYFLSHLSQTCAPC